MVLDDVAAEHESEARAAGLGREERNPQIVGARESVPVIFNLECQSFVGVEPTNLDRAVLVDGFRGILHQVDQDLKKKYNEDLSREKLKYAAETSKLNKEREELEEEKYHPNQKMPFESTADGYRPQGDKEESH